MEESSWWNRIGSKVPRRRSTDRNNQKDAKNSLRRSYSSYRESGSEFLDPDQFDDVFGGPPRTVFLRQFSGDFFENERVMSFYDEVFRPEEGPGRNGRNLPTFRIPSAISRGGFRRNDAFYDDIFGSDENQTSRLRTKRAIKMVTEDDDEEESDDVDEEEEEELNRFRPLITEDVAFSSFASKLRPITVPSRHSFSSSISRDQRKQSTPAVQSEPSPFMEYQYTETFEREDFGNQHYVFPHRHTSPETISLEPNSYRSIKISMGEPEADSPSSAISSVFHEPDPRAGIQVRNIQERGEIMGQEEDKQEEEEEEGDEVESSYVIEIGSDRKEETDEASAVDDAIAWAKEKFFSYGQDDFEDRHPQKIKETYNEVEIERYLFTRREESLSQSGRGGHGSSKYSGAKTSEMKRWGEEEALHSEKNMAMMLLDEDVKLWSAGKEGNIRSLLSTLQYILWPNSGWHPLPMMNMINASQVKKAYQKAILCLHPDKLQQKKATPQQKYVAEKVFTILQSAWAVFDSHQVYSS